ncbi:MAG: hypothetical protein Q4C49_12595 [Bacillota bacterium]|nr:hypothetical protein [Bacillota bacterium]
MDKKEQLKEYIIQDLIEFIIEDDCISIEEAMNKLYRSKTFELLQDNDTGLYLQGSSYVYELYKEEKK